MTERAVPKSRKRRVKERREIPKGGLGGYFRRARWLGLIGQVGASVVTVLLCWSFADQSRLIAYLVVHQLSLLLLAGAFAVPLIQRWKNANGVPILSAGALVVTQLLGASVLWYDLEAAQSVTFTLAAFTVMYGCCAFTIVTLGPVKDLARMALISAVLPSTLAALVAGHYVIGIASVCFMAIMGVFGISQMHRAYIKFISRHTKSMLDVKAAETMARQDSLTSLFNRVGISQQFEARRTEFRSAFFIDLDRFKKVNDDAGHLAGDELLRQVAGRLSRSAPKGTSIARVGGDEFMMLMAGDDTKEIVELGQRIISALEEPFSLSGATYSISASIGVALIRSNSTLERVFHESDNAMFRAKRNGRGRVTVFSDDMDVEIRAREELEKDVFWLIDRGEFPVYGQPIYDMESGALRSVELLVRPKLRNGSTLSPAVMLPVLEELKMIDVMTGIILQQAAKARAHWRTIDVLANVAISVNIPPQAVIGDWLAPEVENLLKTYDLGPGELIFEVTEQALTEEPEKSHATLSALRELGVDLVLDDFGVGYSSLKLLLNFPVSTVKVDQSIVQAADTTKVAGRFMQAIIEVARSLDHDVVAEGIESRSQMNAAYRAGANMGQGYLLSRPKPLDRLVASLTNQPKATYRAQPAKPAANQVGKSKSVKPTVPTS